MMTRIGFCMLVALITLPTVALSKDPLQSASSPDAQLVVGDSYTVRAQRHKAYKTFKGDLVKVNERWLVLHHLSRGSDRGLTNLAKMPVVGRWFRAAIELPVDEYVWIPRDAAFIESHGTPQGQASSVDKLGDDPAEQISCTIEFAKGERIERRDGGMESVRDEGLTIAVPRKVNVEPPLSGFGLASLAGDSTSRARTETRYSRQLISRADVLCVRVGSLNPAILTVGSR